VKNLDLDDISEGTLLQDCSNLLQRGLCSEISEELGAR
jgi:hypothetical protein